MSFLGGLGSWQWGWFGLFLSLLSLSWASYVMMVGFRGRNNLLQCVFATTGLLGMGRRKYLVSVAG